MINKSAFNCKFHQIKNQETLVNLQIPGSFLVYQRILSPHTVLDPHRVLSGSSQGPGSRFCGMPFYLEYVQYKNPLKEYHKNTSMLLIKH